MINDVVHHYYLLMHKEPGIISHPLTYMLLLSFLFVFKSHIVQLGGNLPGIGKNNLVCHISQKIYTKDKDKNSETERKNG